MTPPFHENRTHARLAASLRMRDLMRKYKQTTTRRKAEIETELGWKAAENFETGIEKTISWYLNKL